MLVIPLQPLPAQALTVSLDSQPVQLTIRQRSTGLFADVYVNNGLIIGGVICQDRNRLIRDAYLGFVGDLAFYDTQGVADPYYTGLGSRYLLAYLDAADLATMGFEG
jgi:hypothetical protein